MRCGHTWNSHDGSPKRCPSCGSRLWDVEPESTFVAVEETSDMEDDVMKEYRRGSGCLDISLALGIPYSVVRSIVSRKNPGVEPRV